MALVSPFITEKFIARIVDVMTSNLTFAVLLIDDYTQEGPVGRVEVKLQEGGPKVVKNLSGYHLFTDLAHGVYTVSVESDYYSTVEEAVDTSLLDAKNPVVQIVLKPNSRYPFPAGSTLLRGMVSNGSPIAGADVSVTGKTITTNTDERGEFVLHFRGIKTETITVVIQKGGDTKSIGATIEEGKTVTTGVIHFP
jgi:phosphatidate phosphatase APP1